MGFSLMSDGCPRVWVQLFVNTALGSLEATVPFWDVYLSDVFLNECLGTSWTCCE